MGIFFPCASSFFRLYVFCVCWSAGSLGLCLCKSCICFFSLLLFFLCTDACVPRSLPRSVRARSTDVEYVRARYEHVERHACHARASHEMKTTLALVVGFFLFLLVVRAAVAAAVFMLGNGLKTERKSVRTCSAYAVGRRAVIGSTS